MSKKIKYIHIAIIIIGIIFICIPNFHTNLWFDESYTVGMVERSFNQIWTIGSYDVHPVLYYWILKLFALILENKIIIYRLLSVIAIAILGIIGFTHIRKDFGEKVRTNIFVFSIVYANESDVFRRN